MKQALEAELRTLLDKQAIHDLVLTIARGTDRYDGRLLSECIARDAVIDLGGPEPMKGAAFASALKPPSDPRPGRMHLIANVLVDVDGNSAFAESYFVSYQDILREGERATRIRSGRYLDKFRRDGHGWKLAQRTIVDEWARQDKVIEPVPQGRHLGKPAPADLLYAVLQTLGSKQERW
jgi:hypothetical protein